METNNTCGVCGLPLTFSEKKITLKCSFCGKDFETESLCPKGHYFCEACAKLDPGEILMQVLSKSNSKSPSELLEKVVAHPAVGVHGQMHHFIVPTVIVAAASNAGYANKGVIMSAVERGNRIPGGSCGLCGACGAAVGVGIAVSVLTKATPTTGEPRSLALEATSLALSKMLDKAPRCCKKESRVAVECAVEYLRDRLGMTLEKADPVKCQYSLRNRECIKQACKFYDLPA